MIVITHIHMQTNKTNDKNIHTYTTHIRKHVQYMTIGDEQYADEHTYDDNANYDDVFDTKHVVQAIEDIHRSNVNNSTYNNSYKLYFDDEYHEFNHNSQKCVDNERVSTQHTQTQETYTHKQAHTHTHI